MTRTTATSFPGQYRTALRLHLRQRPRSSSVAARNLGRAAVTLGLETLDLAHLHDRTLATLTTPGRPGAGPSGPEAMDRDGHGRLTPAGVFLLEALTPLELAHRIDKTAAAQKPRLDEKLRERAAALAVARREMQREIARRKAGEAQLEQSAQRNSELLAQSRRMQDQLRHLAHQILSAQEEERKEISRELHDEIAQILAGINVQLATLKEAAAINTRGLRQRISKTQQLVEKSVQAVHRFARELRPALLDDLGLIPALRSYMKALPGRKRLRIHFSAFANVEALDNRRRTVLYRVAQEALTNVARHAHARTVTVRITKIPDAVRLEVRDDGRSFSVESVLSSRHSKRLGLLGMRERVEMVGGCFSIESAPGHGTTVCAEIPFNRGHTH